MMGIDPSAVIHPMAVVEAGASIGPGCVIGPFCVVGPEARLDAAVTLKSHAVVPGWTETEMTEGGRQNDKFLTSTTSRTPIRRWGKPEDFRRVGAFLADPTQIYHTGDEIILDGGYTRF